MLLLLLSACSAVADPAPPAIVANPDPDPFEAFLAAPLPVSDGFSAPISTAWTPCGAGCGTATRATALTAWADGRITAVQPTGFTLRHDYYENHQRRELETRFAGLSTPLAVGTDVHRGDTLATGTDVRITLVGVEGTPEDFAAARPSLPVPQSEPVLALLHHDSLSMRIYERGTEVGRFNVSFGQATGAKEQRGDNRSPKGVYYVVEKSTGPFGGDYAAYFGGIFIRINYPNAWDAARGVDQGLITVEEQRAISTAWRRRAFTSKSTPLGGGIGLHGWAREWADDGPRNLSWGCVVLHLSDVARVYELLPARSMVVLF